MKTLCRLMSLPLLLSSVWATAAEVMNFDISERSCVAHGASSWGYYGQLSWSGEGKAQEILLPNDWGFRYEACGRALAPLHRQSPIELPAPKSLGSRAPNDVEFPGYGERQVRVEHNCHTIQATLLNHENFPNEVLRIGGYPYRLLQFHLHTPSEHVITTTEAGSVNYPGELHFVHAALRSDGSLDPNRLAVVGMFIDLSATAGEESIERFFAALARDYKGTQTAGHETDPITVKLGRLKAKNREFWRYRGSLTTPPCSESVEWIVLEQPVVMSLETFRQLQQAKFNVGFANARPPFLPTRQHGLRFSGVR